jgi:unsaturated chondroitin disaccharide hydrolase
MGFLYSPSCVAGYKLIGSEQGRKAAIKAADKLISRYHSVGEFIQAWGPMDEPENYRLIIDCLLNLPLLYWASEETKDMKYKEIAEKHIHTAIKNVIREDYSTWHTFYFDIHTGKPDHGATCQGYRDGSAWARGQAWGIYGIALNYRYANKAEYLEAFEKVAQYFIKHLPQDMVPYWDFEFHDGSKEPRDSSSAAIAACGMLEMAQFLPEEKKDYYNDTAKKTLKSLYDNYRVKDHESSNGLLLHGTYSKHSPYNTCNESGVDECTAWGDYFYLEALTRLNGKLVSCW